MRGQFHRATGDPGSPQILETYVAVLWRVRDEDAANFYMGLSHAEWYDKEKDKEKDKDNSKKPPQ